MLSWEGRRWARFQQRLIISNREFHWKPFQSLKSIEKRRSSSGKAKFSQIRLPPLLNHWLQSISRRSKPSQWTHKDYLCVKWLHTATTAELDSQLTSKAKTASLKLAPCALTRPCACPKRRRRCPICWLRLIGGERNGKSNWKSRTSSCDSYKIL